MMPAMHHSLTSTAVRSSRFVRVSCGVALMCAAFASVARAQTSADAPTTIFLVRHAERPPDNADVPLNAEGRARAATLASMLKEASVSAIFVSQFLRTRQTAEPLAQQLGLTPEAVHTSDLDALVRKLEALPAGSVALVVHHGGTVPQIVAKLGGKIGPIQEHEHDRLVIVTRGQGKTQAVMLHYGQPSPAPASSR
jgi:broad specificity phosphatase PhoE